MGDLVEQGFVESGRVIKQVEAGFSQHIGRQRPIICLLPQGAWPSRPITPCLSLLPSIASIGNLLRCGNLVSWTLGLQDTGLGVG